MQLDAMDTPTTRADFECRLHLLLKQTSEEKFNAVQGGDIGIDQVRFLPNGRIDLLSINQFIQLQANTMHHIQNSELFKSLLCDISEKYSTWREC